MAEQVFSDENLTIEPILLRNDHVSAEIDPKGAFVNSLIIDGDTTIFPRNVDNPKRGGIPILGPIPGPIVGTTWENIYPKMHQHGSDRETVWDAFSVTKTGVILERLIGAKEFLFNGRLIIKFNLLDKGIEISRSITNFEDKPREIGSAFHPYFTFNRDSVVGPAGIAKLFPLTSGKSVIIKPGISLVTLSRESISYKIIAKPQPHITLLWTDNPDKYVCLEPWWAEKGKGDIIGPRETKKYTLKIIKN